MSEGRICPGCGSDGARLLLRTTKQTSSGEFYDVVTCTRCDLRYTRPLPGDEDLAALYPESYYVSNSTNWLSADVLRRAFEQGVQWRHRQALLDRPPGRILDVGCGSGDFLAALISRGWEVHATEFSDAAVTMARKRGISVHQGTVEDAAFPDDFFDVVTMWHVLEHVPAPRETLSELRRILKRDGLLVIEVPDSASVTFRLTDDRWMGLDVPRHLQHFTPTTLGHLLADTGFIPISRQTFHHWDFLFAFNSFLSRVGVLDRLGVHYFSTDFKRAPLRAKAIFLLFGVYVGLLCIPYSVAMALGTGSSETLTFTSRKAAAASLPTAGHVTGLG
jgi:ubiquinone/menaquinone biosynthesis C-methylase UbiE